MLVNEVWPMIVFVLSDLVKKHDGEVDKFTVEEEVVIRNGVFNVGGTLPTLPWTEPAWAAVKDDSKPAVFMALTQ